MIAGGEIWNRGGSMKMIRQMCRVSQKWRESVRNRARVRGDVQGEVVISQIILREVRNLQTQERTGNNMTNDKTHKHTKHLTHIRDPDCWARQLLTLSQGSAQ